MSRGIRGESSREQVAKDEKALRCAWLDGAPLDDALVDPAHSRLAAGRNTPSFQGPSQLQNGILPMADRIPLTTCFLKKACPTKPEPSIQAAESWPRAVTQERPPS